jgi:hypothetical protein
MLKNIPPVHGMLRSRRVARVLEGLARRIAPPEVPSVVPPLPEERLLSQDALADYARWNSAQQQNRLIETEYPYHPKLRPLEAVGAGLRLTERLRSHETAFRLVLRDLAAFAPRLGDISLDTPSDAAAPFWRNGWMPPTDGVSLYGLVARHAPRRYIEIGSGNSTRFVRRAILDFNLRTKIISIDPQPRAEIDAICDDVVRRPSEDVEQAFWESIGGDDILFVDNSHRCFQNSDVSVFFTDILPVLKPGTIYGLHDIFLPLDYPRDWLGRFYNEQYMLLSYLEGGARGDEVLLPNAWICGQPGLREILNPIWQGIPELIEMAPLGGAFWMRRCDGDPVLR